MLLPPLGVVPSILMARDVSEVPAPAAPIAVTVVVPEIRALLAGELTLAVGGKSMLKDVDCE